MTISTINRIKTVANKLKVGDGSIITIYENTGLTIGNELIVAHEIISFNCFIKNLRAFALINSLAEISLPNFTLDDSETDKLYKTLNTEWNSARKQITLYISNQLITNPNGQGWFKVGSLSLLNPSGYPYRVYNLMDLFTDNLAIELGDNGKIGVQIEDVGYGLLSATDEVTIHGSYIEEIFVQSPDPKYVNIISGGGNTPVEPEPVPIIPFPVEALFRISANDLQLVDNQPVATWQQSGTSSATITQEVAASQPVYKTNILTIKNAVYFDGNNKFLAVDPPSNFTGSVELIPSTGDWIIFLVAKFDGVGFAISNYTLLGDTYNPNASIGSYSSTVSTFGEYNGHRNYFVDYSISGWNIHALRKEGNSVNAYINGTVYSISDVYEPITSRSAYLEKAVIGCNSGNTNFLTGYIADITILNSHTIADINAIGSYYKNLYNLPWTSI